MPELPRPASAAAPVAPSVAASVVPSAAAPVAASETARPWEYSAFPVTVARKRQLTPGFIRVTLAGAALRNFAPWGLDQRIKLVLPMADGSRPEFGLLDEPTPHPKQWYTRWKALPDAARNVLRTYTPAAIRPDAGEIDVDLYIHEPAGPASAWALACEPGDELVITGPDIRAGYTGYGIHWKPGDTPRRVLLVGDESALPAIANLLASLPDGTACDVFVELGDPADNTLAAPGAGTRIHVVERVSPAGQQLERAVREWAGRNVHALVGDTPSEDESVGGDVVGGDVVDGDVIDGDLNGGNRPGAGQAGGNLNGGDIAGGPGAYAWIAGEAAATTGIRGFLTSTIGMPKERVAFLGYWKLGGALIG